MAKKSSKTSFDVYMEHLSKIQGLVETTFTKKTPYLEVLEFLVKKFHDSDSDREVSSCDFTLGVVGSTKTFPVTHSQIIQEVSSSLGVCATLSESKKEYVLKGKDFFSVLCLLVLRTILPYYDRLSQDYIRSLDCETSVKRTLRKEFTSKFALDSVSVIAKYFPVESSDPVDSAPDESSEVVSSVEGQDVVESEGVSVEEGPVVVNEFDEI